MRVTVLSSVQAKNVGQFIEILVCIRACFIHFYNPVRICRGVDVRSIQAEKGGGNTDPGTKHQGGFHV